MSAGNALTLTNLRRGDQTTLDELGMQHEFLLHMKCLSTHVGIRQHAVSRSLRIDVQRQRYLQVLRHQAQQKDVALQFQMTLVRWLVSIDLRRDERHSVIFEVLPDHLGHQLLIKILLLRQI